MEPRPRVRQLPCDTINHIPDNPSLLARFARMCFTLALLVNDLLPLPLYEVHIDKWGKGRKWWKGIKILFCVPSLFSTFRLWCLLHQEELRRIIKFVLWRMFLFSSWLPFLPLPLAPPPPPPILVVVLFFDLKVKHYGSQWWSVP